MIGDHYRDEWPNRFPWLPPNPDLPTWPTSPDSWSILPKPPFPDYPLPQQDGPTQEQFDDLKRQVEDMKKLLEKAVEYDKKNNEPHCEIEDKMEFLRKVAALVGISLDDVIPVQPKAGF